jgi:ribosomal protein S18 acetylase RimI-like enzyme
VTVRPAGDEDAEAIELVRIETWRTTYRGLVADAILDGMTVNADARRAQIRSRPAGQFLFVATDDDGRVVGFAAGGPERTGDPDYRGEVYAIYVLPAHQGRGHGRALIRESVRALAAAGLDSLLIWVLRENTIGRGFYERLGGRPIREKPLEMRGLEDQIEVAYAWRDTAALR